MVVKAVSMSAHAKGIQAGMVVADCRAILPELKVIDDIPGKAFQLLNSLAEWCLRYTPIAAPDMPDGVILDVSGCAHLWGGEPAYLKDIQGRLSQLGYNVRMAVADTIGTAWAVARYGKAGPIITTGGNAEALFNLPPVALRLDANIVDRLEKLGLYRIRDFIKMPRTALRRRFGLTILSRIDQALGKEAEVIEPVQPVQQYQERLPCMEPIRTATGISIALKQLLEKLCSSLATETMGLRTCVFTCYRIDGNLQQIGIGTNRPTRNTGHLFKLFEDKIQRLEPRLGFEQFDLSAPIVESLTTTQEALWSVASNKNETAVAELLDRITCKMGNGTYKRYLPDEHYWPERSIRVANGLSEKIQTTWPASMPRPTCLLLQPERIDVSVPLPDYPPMLFRHRGNLHKVARADGPERIEQEWWMEEGTYRDYYCLEDEQGARYWVFRSGDYAETEPDWYIHGHFS